MERINVYRQAQEILKGLQQNEYIMQKYNKPGIYSISINNKIVYIGKSSCMINRLSAHIANINVENGYKYKVLNQAIQRGIPITFGVLYEAKSNNIDEELGYKEGEYIRLYSPCLNTQIPEADNWRKFKINKKAQYIKLEDIIQD